MAPATTTTTTTSTTMTKPKSSRQIERPPGADGDPFEIEQELRCAPRPRPGHTSNIVEFYKGRSVLITGASGFIGKVLIEKLLRTCPTIERVFVLIRPKYNKEPQERLRELLASRLFDGLRGGNQRWLEQKVCLVEGDVTEANLGLSSLDLTRIIQAVSVIFHSAATVKFDEPLKQSVAINLTGTKNMVELCRRIPRLAGLVHVSTAYSNCDLEAVDEHIYPVDMEPEHLMEMAQWLDQETLQELKRRLLGAKPNTYTYTKSLAEWLLVRSARDLPVVICRPSIVVASASEPFRGWIDNMNGPTGVVLGTGKGLIRSMYAENEFTADLVPVDKVINLIVALGWFAHLNKSQQKSEGGLLGVSLSDSLLTSSSACSSSGAGSSAASTSGADDSLQEDEFERRSPAAAEESPAQGQLLKLRCRRHQAQICRRHNRHKRQEQRQQQQRRRGRSLDACSSHEEECADLSIASESSSVHSADRDASSGRRVLKRRQHNDDGYASRSPRYANSVASSNAGSAKQRRRPGEKSGKSKCKIMSTSEKAARETAGNRSRGNELCDSADSHADLMRVASDDDYELFKANSDAFGARLRKFRAATLAKLSEKGLPEEIADVPVFHCTSGGENPISWGQVQLFILTALAVFPSSATYRYPCGSFTNSPKLDRFYALTLHYLPAYLVDFLTRLTGGRPVLVRIFEKFDKAASVLKAFTSKQWKFGCENRLFLMEELMNEEDRRLFDCDIKSLDWRQFCRDYVIGVRKFLLKEPMSSLAAARRNLRLVYYRNLCLQLVFVAAGAACAVSSYSWLAA